MNEEFHYKINFIDLAEVIFSKIIRRKKSTIFYLKKDPILSFLIFNSFTNRYFKKYDFINDIGEKKGLYFKLHDMSYKLTENYFNFKKIEDNSINKLCKQKFKTDKFNNYFKLCIANEIMDFLTYFWLFYLDKGSKTTLKVKQDDLTIFIIKNLRKEEINLNILWSNRKNGIFNCFFLAMGYLLWLIFFVIKKGVTFRWAKKEYQISKETADGVYEKKRFLSDDFFINDNYIKKDKVIFYYTGSEHEGRKKAFQQVKDKGYLYVDISKLQFNIKSLWMLLVDYFMFPLRLFLDVIISRDYYLVKHFVYFLIRALRLEPFLSLYSPKVNITVNDESYFQAIETIIFNKYGIKNILYHWSDLTTYMSVFHQYVTANVYFVWGGNSLRYYGKSFQVEEIITIGFQGWAFYKKAIEDKENIKARIKGCDSRYPFISFFDTSFAKNFLYSEKSIIDFLKLIEEFARKGKSNILLKVKSIDSYKNVLNNEIKVIFNHLSNIENIHILDNYQWDFLEVIAISDVCVSMGMSSPTTIALILNKPAFYYDNLNSKQHPFFDKYKDKLVFDDKNKLFAKIIDFTGSKDSLDNFISREDMKAYDEFQDGYELKRFCEIVNDRCMRG